MTMSPEGFKAVYTALQVGTPVNTPRLHAWVAEANNIYKLLATIPEYRLIAADIMAQVTKAQGYLRTRTMLGDSFA